MKMKIGMEGLPAATAPCFADDLEVPACGDLMLGWMFSLTFCLIKFTEKQFCP